MPKRLRGSGIFDPITKRLTAVFTHYTNSAPERFIRAVRLLNPNRIQAIFLDRTPVQKFVKTALNVLTHGNFSKNQQNLKYDDIYHNYMVIHLSNGQKYKLQKNHVVEIHPTSENGIHPIHLSNQVSTVEALLNRANQRYSELYVYHPEKNNCQKFVYDVLTSNGCYPTTPEGREVFQPQNSSKLLEKSIIDPSRFTNIASWGDRILHGGQITNQMPKRSRSQVKPNIGMSSYHQGKKLQSGGYILPDGHIINTIAPVPDWKERGWKLGTPEELAELKKSQPRRPSFYEILKSTSQSPGKKLPMSGGNIFHRRMQTHKPQTGKGLFDFF